MLKFDTLENPQASRRCTLLHGWGSSSLSWQPLIPFLEQQYSLTLVDLPGHGNNVDGAYLWNDPEQLFTQLQNIIDPNSILIGWSLGGMLACQLMAKGCGAALITLASNACFVQQPYWPSAMAQDVFDDFYTRFKTNSIKTLNRFLHLQTQGEAESRALMQQLKVSMSEADEMLGGLTMLSTLDNKEVLSAISGLHLFGEKDALVPSSAAQAIAGLGANQSHVIESAGHYLHGKPERIWPIIQGYLS